MNKVEAVKSTVAGLSKLYNHRTRLGLMGILLVNDWVDFVTLRNALKLSDGSLAGHIKALHKAGQIETEKRFVDDKPRTSYRATPAGREAFERHLEELEEFLKIMEN
ncbi:winged helix-turn-helix domain-containing protein [Neolewinella litorea]|uniref:Transcriptional regulator n=1 Tax=Neolewinella litorea TaxID=2562452 RepID=A0A4S4NSX2_9BACT|nr:transcriptional regulator [Neolewinella litorea]THH41571.1 transcriptional regulator [Neolewinella litorea]